MEPAVATSREDFSDVTGPDCWRELSLDLSDNDRDLAYTLGALILDARRGLAHPVECQMTIEKRQNGEWETTVRYTIRSRSANPVDRRCHWTDHRFDAFRK